MNLLECPVSCMRMHKSDKLLSFCNTGQKDTFKYVTYWSLMFYAFLYFRKRAVPCFACHAVVTVHHILIECDELIEIREKYSEETLFIHRFKMSAWRDFLASWNKLEIGLLYKKWDVLRWSLREVFWWKVVVVKINFVVLWLMSRISGR